MQGDTIEGWHALSYKTHEMCRRKLATAVAKEETDGFRYSCHYSTREDLLTLPFPWGRIDTVLDDWLLPRPDLGTTIREIEKTRIAAQEGAG